MKTTMSVSAAVTFLLLIMITGTFADTLVLQPGSEGIDTYICDCAPNQNNPYGPTSALYQGQYDLCYDRLLIQWDISELPTGATITSAIMELYFVALHGSMSGQMAYYRILEDWDETGVTFNTQPDTCHDVQAITDWPVGVQWYEVDITEFVQGWYDGSLDNYGLYGYCINTTGTCCAEFRSSDYGVADDRPRLTIEYNTAKVSVINQPEPLTFALYPNYPNPFNPTTNLTFSLPTAGNISLVVFDIQGREVSSVFNGWFASGDYHTVFDGADLPSGIYFARLSAGTFQQTQKMMLTK